MLAHHDTIPEEPDWNDCYKEFHYGLFLRLEFKSYHDYPDDYPVATADLTKYYEWAKENNIPMRHSIMITTNHGGMGKIRFMFNDDTYSMAFKLRWK